MATAAIFANGTLVKLDDGAGNYTTIAEVLSVTGPQVQLQTIEVTSMDSPGKIREFIAGLIDMGMISFDINYQPAVATHGYSTGLLYLLINRIKRNIRIVFTDGGGTTWTLPCYVTKLSPGMPMDGALKASVELRIAGQSTLA